MIWIVLILPTFKDFNFDKDFIMNKALIKVLTLTTLLPMATIVQADMKPYIEGQINYYNLDDIRSDTVSGSITSGGATLSGSANIENEYDTDTTAGVEFGFKINKNSRIGFSYSKPSFDLENITLSVGATLTDGVDTITGSASQKFSRAELGTVAAENTFDNTAKLYSLNYYYDFNSSNIIQPFLGFGLGIADIQNAEDKELMYSLHGGARYFFNDNAYLGGKFSYGSIKGIKDGFGLTYEDIDYYSGTLAVGFEF